MTKKTKIAFENWKTAISKMPSGRSYDVPFYGKIKAYRKPDGSRAFSVSKSAIVIPGGNRPLGIILADLKWIYSNVVG